MDPIDALMIVVLDRIAYSMLAFHRAITPYSEKRRCMPWKNLFTRLLVTLVAATADMPLGLRYRPLTADQPAERGFAPPSLRRLL